VHAHVVVVSPQSSGAGFCSGEGSEGHCATLFVMTSFVMIAICVNCVAPVDASVPASTALPAAVQPVEMSQSPHR